MKPGSTDLEIDCLVDLYHNISVESASHFPWNINHNSPTSMAMYMGCMIGGCNWWRYVHI